MLLSPHKSPVTDKGDRAHKDFDKWLNILRDEVNRIRDVGLVAADIGVTVQAWSANLDEYAAVNPTAAGLALLDDADNTAQRTTLGLGTISTQDADSVNIDGGSIDSTTIGATTPAAITGSSVTVSNTANAAFTLTDTNAGTNIKSFRWNQNGGQLSLEGLNDAGTVNLTAMTFVRTAATTVDIAITANNGDITLSPTLDLNINVPRDILINQTGAGSVDNLNADIVNVAIDGNNSFTINGDEVLTEANIGSTIQAYSANLDEYAAVNPTTAGLALLDDATASDQATTLGLGTGDTPQFTGVTLVSADAAATAGPILTLYRNSASPAIGDALGVIRFDGENSAGDQTTYANIRAEILDPDSAGEAAKIVFRSFVAGTTAERLFIGGGLVLFGATGGDQGTGTVNATSVYDDGVILTDYVPDAYIDGDYSVTDYDSRIPPRRLEDGTVVPRQHGPARRFKNNFDELNPADFAAKWKATRKLPAFNRGPAKKSTGEAIQALIETCEVQAVHIDQLLERIIVLEAA